MDSSYLKEAEKDFHQYLGSSCLKEAVKEGQFPPRFKVKLNWHGSSNPNTLDLKYNICFKRHGEEDEHKSLNIFILSNTSDQPIQTTKPWPLASFTGIDTAIYKLYF